MTGVKIHPSTGGQFSGVVNTRIGSLGLQFSRGWDESIDRKKGFFDSEWGVPESWDSVILQGPHLYVATPMYKSPNETMLHHLDWTETDFEALAPDAVPVTAYKPRGDRAKYDSAYTHWTTEPGGTVTPARDYYRVAWRNMAANTGERTLIPAIIPPRGAHVDGVYSLATPDRPETLVCIAASMSTLLSDFAIRVAPKSTIRSGSASRLPSVVDTDYVDQIVLRSLRLNCVTAAYAALWEQCFRREFALDTWTSINTVTAITPEIGQVNPSWDFHTPLRLPRERRQALIELDALVALSLGITADELATIYRTQFPVLYGYDQKSLVYDANGRVVPTAIQTTWRSRGRNDGKFADTDLTSYHAGSGREYTYALPFSVADRAQDMHAAHVEFERRIRIRSSKV